MPATPKTLGSRFAMALADWVADLGEVVFNWMATLGDVSVFFLRIMAWMVRRLPRRETLLPAFYQTGVLSLPVVALTGTFIGMVLAVQSYSQFRMLHLVPRFLACLLLIPMLTIMADFMGVVGGFFYSVQLLGIDSHHYWANSQKFVGAYDLYSGLVKSLF